MREAPIQLAQLTIEQRVIIRIPTVRGPGAAPRQAGMIPPALPELDTFKESKGPKCLKLKHIRGAMISPASGVVMTADKEAHFRAHFGRLCRPADFYAGFYIEPNKDGSLCAGRDVLHARNGSSCEIERFSKLVADD